MTGPVKLCRITCKLPQLTPVQLTLNLEPDTVTACLHFCRLKALTHIRHQCSQPAADSLPSLTNQAPLGSQYCYMVQEYCSSLSTAS